MMRAWAVIAVIFLAGCDEAAQQRREPAAADSPEVQRLTENLPVTLTPAAAAEVRRVMAEHRLGAKSYFRVAVRETDHGTMQYNVNFDNVHTVRDVVFESQGVTLVVDNVSRIYLDGTTIDFVPVEDGGTGFLFDNPNAAPPSVSIPAGAAETP